MSLQKKSVKVKSGMSVEAVTAVLEDLVKCFRDGLVCVESGDRFVTLTPQADVEIELEASTKKNRQRLSLEMNWKRIVPVDDELTQVDFKISNEEPEEEEESLSEMVQDAVEEAEEAIEDAVEEAEEAIEEAVEEAGEKERAYGASF